MNPEKPVNGFDVGLTLIGTGVNECWSVGTVFGLSSVEVMRLGTN